MILRYERERGYTGEGKDPSLTLGKQYFALGITFRVDNENLVSIQRESDGTPCLFRLCHFSIVDASIPKEWIIKSNNNGDYTIEPIEFNGNFWDLYHDADQKAEEVFLQVIEKIKQSHIEKPINF